jgi:hypothetical protein
MQKALLGCVSLILTLGLLAVPACKNVPTGEVIFDDLVNHPASYNGHTVTVECFYFSGFEINALASALMVAGSTSRLTPRQPLIWVSGLSTNLQSQLHSQSDTPSGYKEYFGKVQMTGIFDYGGKYGQLDSYIYQFRVSSAGVLPWESVFT